MGLSNGHQLSSLATNLQHPRSRQELWEIIICRIVLRILVSLRPCRYSVVLRGEVGPASTPVAVKVYEKPSMTPKKQKMATREAIVLKYLNAQG